MNPENDQSELPDPLQTANSPCPQCAANTGWRLKVERRVNLTGVTRMVHAVCARCDHTITVLNRELNLPGRLLGRLAQVLGVARYPEPAPLLRDQTHPPHPARTGR